MSSETVYRMAFLILLVALLIMRVYFMITDITGATL